AARADDRRAQGAAGGGGAARRGRRVRLVRCQQEGRRHRPRRPEARQADRRGPARRRARLGRRALTLTPPRRHAPHHGEIREPVVIVCGEEGENHEDATSWPRSSKRRDESMKPNRASTWPRLAVASLALIVASSAAAGEKQGGWTALF